MRYFFLILYFSSFLYAVSSLNSDGVALLSLSRRWTFVPPTLNSSWSASDSTPCSWVGVQCDHAHNVVSLNLTSYGISGQVGPEIGSLSHLRTFVLADNGFSGKIPLELGDCSLLVHLDLSENSFSGQIPNSLRKLLNLHYVSFFSNMLTDEIPQFLFEIPHLKELYLYDNRLTGPVPTNIGNSAELKILYLYSNQLNGTIPSSIGNCSKLKELSLESNLLHGVIPESLNNLRNLAFLDVSDNNLEGIIPFGSGSCESLSSLDLSLNVFSGGIPSGLGNCSNLKQFAAVGSNLSGSIPSSLGQLRNLFMLRLPENLLSGKIPPEIGNCKSLEELQLYSNRLEGDIPGELGKLSELRDLGLFSNYLVGEIPLSIWKIQSLEQILAYNNSLSGELPSDVGRCTTLRRMILKENNFTGPLPDFERNPNLLYVEISKNNIGGTLPSSLGNLTNATAIILYMNKISGLLPPGLGSLVNIRTLNLSHNKLEGSLPPQLSNCSRMDRFDVGFNFLNGSFPSSLGRWTGLTTLILRENHFTGGIPAFLSEFENLDELQLGGNMFGGEIPKSIGALQNLRYGLNLSANGLTGEIPPEFGKLQNLERLDLSHNNLTGSIQALDQLSSLGEANISCNSFVGPVPMSLMKLLNSSSFLGNPGLCVSCSSSGGLSCMKDSYLKPCDFKPTNHKGLRGVQIVLIALGSSIFAAFMLLAVVFVILRGRRRSKQEVEIPGKEGSSSLLSKVMEATSNLNERYIIGRGAHGVVYKAALDADRVYAVKKFVFAGNRGNRSGMMREIQTIGKIRHRNLVKLEDYWPRKDYGLILYSYMPNGSLDYVLHEKTPAPTLEWNLRFKITVGIAHALAYLHHDCDPPIVHRDVKPKNILLDSDMEPHISDFGIAKLWDHSGSSTPSIAVPGTIGYIAPENAYTTAKGMESDVYSYGVVVLEIISRKKAVDPSFVEGTGIVGWVRSVWDETGGINRIVDSGLAQELLDSNVMEQAEKVLSVALRCTDKDPRNRPTMRDVIKQLLDANSHSRAKGRKSYA